MFSTVRPFKAARPTPGMRAWLRKTAAVVTATLVGTTALTATGITSAPAAAATPAITVTDLDFQDGTWAPWRVNGDAVLEVVPEYVTVTYETEFGEPVYPVAPALPEAAEWVSTAIYNNGDLVALGDRVFIAQWWTQNQRPGDPNGPWMEYGVYHVAADETVVAEWTASWVYAEPGNVVLYEGQLFRNQWHSRNQSPHTPWGPWQLVGDFEPALPYIPETVTRVETPSENLVLNVTRTNNWDGPQTPAGLLTEGAQYRFEATLRLAPGVEGTANARIIGVPGFNYVSGWPGTAITADEWTTLSGTWTAVAGANAWIGVTDIDGLEVFDFRIDSIVVTQIAPAPAPAPAPEPGPGTEPATPNRALRITQTADWQGLQIPGNMFVGGETYRLQARALDANPVGAVRFVSQTDGNDFAWIGHTAVNTETWVDIDATFTARSTGINHVRLVGNAPGTFYVDDLLVTRVDGSVVYANDFETPGDTSFGGDGGTFANDIDPLAPVVEPETPEINRVLSIAQTADWQGLQIPGTLFDGGEEYRLEARVLDGTTGGAARFVSQVDGNDFAWIGNTALSTENWANINTTFIARSTGINHARLVGGTAGTFYVDDVRVTRVATGEVIYFNDFQTEGDTSFGGDGGVFTNVIDPLFVPEVETDGRETWVLVDHLDFSANNFGDWDAGHGGTTAAILANPFGEGNVLQIGRSEDWHGLGSFAGMLERNASYFFEMSIRIAEDGPATADAMFLGQPGWPHIGRAAINNEGWTTISGTWTPVDVGANVRIVTSDVEGYPTYRFYVDYVYVWRTAPSPDLAEIEPGTVVLASMFDADGDVAAFGPEGDEVGFWFERQTTSTNAAFVNQGDAYFSWIPGAGDFAYGLALNNRDNQGDGPMINVANILDGGRNYRFRGYARFLDGTSGNLTLSSQTDGNFTNLVTGIAVGAGWTPISGSFAFPMFDGQANLYFETPWVSGDIGNTADFAIDQFEIYVPELVSWQRDLPGLHTTLNIPAVGVAVDTRELSGTAGEMVLHHFNHIVGENHMKPEAWFGGTGLDSFRRHPQATAMLNFARDNNLTMFGHVLVWHSQTPAWFFTVDGQPGSRQLNWQVPGDTAIMRERLRAHIEAVAGNIAADYGLFGSATNPINSYEVANEVVAGNPNVASGMRENSPWFQAFGPGADGFGSNFLLYAFAYADYYFNNVFHVDGQGRGSDFRAAGDNRITLWINDYNTERGLDSFIGGVRQVNTNTKRYVLLNITNWLIDNGAAVDGVGHQFHAGLQWPVQGLADALELFAAGNGFINRPVLQAITEVDVTIPTPVTEAGLLAQGHYYYQAFEIIRRHQATHGDIDNLTIWGLTDNRSWRADQAPLLFDADFQAKPAFFGSILGGIAYDTRAENPAWELAPIIRTSNVFGATVSVDQAGYDAQIGLLPLEPFATGTGGFTARWSADALYVLADLPVVPGEIRAPGGSAGRRLGIEYAGQDFIVWPDGVLTNSVGAEIEVDGVSAFVNDRAWIVRIAHAPTESSEVGLVVTSIEGSQQSPQGHIWDGQITFREGLSVTTVAQTVTTPNFDSAAWANADVIRTGVNTAGSAAGATADVRTLWRDGGAGFSYLYVLANVNDNTPDSTGDGTHERDSVEVFLGLLNDRGASYEHLYDLQVRFHRNGDVDINGTPPGVHAQRVSHQVREVEGGYILLAAIRLATDTGHLQGNWNSAFGNVGQTFSFDVQVNDGRDGSRYSAMIWADPTGQSWMSTYRWGVAQLVGFSSVAPVAVDTMNMVSR